MYSSMKNRGSDPSEPVVDEHYFTSRSSSSRSPSTFSSSSDSPMTFDYHADCSHSRGAESISETSVASFRSNRLCEQYHAGDYIKIWQICQPFFYVRNNPTQAEGPSTLEQHSHHHLGNDAAASAQVQPQQAARESKYADSFRHARRASSSLACYSSFLQPPVATRNPRQKCNLHESSSSISSSIDESDASSAHSGNERQRESLARQLNHPQQARGERRSHHPVVQQQQQQLHQQLEHPRPKVVSDNTGSGGSNRDSHKTETNSTESNSGGDEGRIARDHTVDQPVTAKDATHVMKHESLKGISFDKQQDSPEHCHRLAVKKRKRMVQRREFEDAGHQAFYSSSSSMTQDSDTSTVKYFKPAGRPITLDDALSFTNMARVVVLGVSPFLVVHANAAFYRFTGIMSSSVVINQPLSSLLCLPDTRKSPSPMTHSLDEGKEDLNSNPLIDDCMEAAIQSVLTSCGHGDVLPMHIFVSRSSQTQGALMNQGHVTLRCDCTSKEASQEDHKIEHLTDHKVTDVLTCNISIRPVIREQTRAKVLGQRNRTNISNGIYPLTCNNHANFSDETISHYVIHMKVKDEGATYNASRHNSAIGDTNMKSDTESCSSSGTKPILACA